MSDKLKLRDGNFENWYSRGLDFFKRSETIDKEKRSVEAVISTEEPVLVYDWQRWEMIDEILLSDGVVLPPNRQVPLLDNHSRWNTTSIKGSVREINIESGQISARLYFARAAKEEWDLVEEGHLTDVSVGYRTDPEESIILAPGEETTVNGRVFKNEGSRTLAIRKKWHLKEVSLTPIGADERAKFRSEFLNNETEPQGQKIDGQERTENNNPEKGGVMPEENKKPDTSQESEAKRGFSEDDVKTKASQMAARAIETIKSLKARGDVLGLDSKEIDELVGKEDYTKPDAEQRTMEAMFKRAEEIRKQDQVPAVPTNGLAGRAGIKIDEFDNFRKAAVNSLRMMGGLPVEEKDVDSLRKSEYYGMGLQGACRAFLALKGSRNAAWMSPAQLCEEALRENARSFSVNSGSLTNVFLDVANKSLYKGWVEAPVTYNAVAGRDRIPNFMQKNIIKVSSLGDVERLNEGEAFPFTKMSDSREVGSLFTVALALSVSRQAIINDDLDAITSIPRKLGESIQRFINRLFWETYYGVAMVGPIMNEDATAMFDAAHNNFVANGAGGAPTLAAVSAGRRAMMKQTLPSPDGGRSNTQYTAIPPKYLIHHMNLDQTVEQLIASSYDPDTGGGANAPNNLRPNRAFVRQLIPVSDPILDELMDAFNGGNGHNGWYLQADPAQMAAVNVYSLTGYESPTIRSKQSDVAEPLGIMMDVYHDVGCGPVEWRGAYANFGQ